MMFLINLGTNLFSLRSPCKSGNPHKFGLDVEIDDALPIRSMKMFLICRTEINKLISLLWYCGLNSGSGAWCNKRSTTHLCSQLHNSRRRERRQEKVCVMCVCVCPCVSVCVSARVPQCSSGGQRTPGNWSLLPPCGFRDFTHIIHQVSWWQVPLINKSSCQPIIPLILRAPFFFFSETASF